MSSYRLLVVALYVQGLLGLARFVAPYLGHWLDERVFMIHPLNGIAIAAASLVLFRPAPNLPGSRMQRVARFVPLLPLALGLGLATVRGLAGPLGGTLLHMLAGFVALEVVGRAAEQRQAALPAGVAAAAGGEAGAERMGYSPGGDGWPRRGRGVEGRGTAGG